MGVFGSISWVWNLRIPKERTILGEAFEREEAAHRLWAGSEAGDAERALRELALQRERMLHCSSRLTTN